MAKFEEPSAKKPRMPGIYAITNKVNGKVYVGQSNNVPARNRGELLQLRRGQWGTHPLQRSWNKYGEGSFVFELICHCSLDQLAMWEEYYIELLQSFKRTHGYNIQRKAGRPSEWFLSTSTREKMSLSKKGKPPNNKGSKSSPESLERRRLASTGRSHSQETKDKISRNNKGKHTPTIELRQHWSKIRKGVRPTDTHRANLSAAKKGRPLSDKNRENLAKVNRITTGHIWYNNGERSMRLPPDQEPPTGWVKGLLHRKRRNKVV